MPVESYFWEKLNPEITISLKQKLSFTIHMSRPMHSAVGLQFITKASKHAISQKTT